MMKKNKTNLIFLVTLLLFLGAVASLVIWIKHLEKRNVQIAIDQKELENEVALMRSMQLVRRSVVTSEEEQAELLKYFIDKEQIPYFLGTLEAIADQVGVVSSISQVLLNREGDRLTVSLRISGSFPSLHQYIQAVEYAPFRLSLQRVFLQHTPQPPTPTNPGIQDRWRADIELVLLSYASDTDNKK